MNGLTANIGEEITIHENGKEFTCKVIAIKEEKPEPKFKPGDKVVPVRKSVWYIGDSGPNCSSWKNGKFQKEYLTVMVMVSDSINYLQGNVSGGQIYRCDGDYYLESDLIPYVEPKPEPKKQEAAFKVGDRVRVKGYWNYDGYKPNLPIEGKHGTIIYGNNVRFDESIGGHGEGCRNWCVDGKYLEPLPSNRCPEPKTITETITYKFKGAKTICIIENEQGKFKGIAKCSPQDEWKESRGMALAKIRAQEAMIRAE